LALLPIHGAGYHDGSGRTVVDRVVSSYTPTLRALLESRRVRAEETEPHMLVVAVPQAPGLPELRDVDRESEMLERLFPGRCRVLAADAADPRHVLDAMTSHPWVHFSCHGFQNLTDPSRAGLILTGGRLRVTDIDSGRFTGNLAFLSACQSATGGLALPDEAITLTAALHYTGFRHVIGTLWSVYDETAASVAEAFYQRISAQGFDADAAAVSLHEAVAAVRGELALPLTKWLPYTHTGP
jgi:CHAT domain-containing protein